ncbi:acyl-CoA dehydrogenase family protein [Streptomyces canus]|uniref:acyl-CoA dehydrogenase family protein n=1 Tax=Streptomyces canus TaxID=58343 RepID=UPI000749791E|nr:acyl-CoA dehydrogenase family protein [Streptomyces canus]KUN11746.1 acyl-CoA dehydrogenase [Streptomyces canus]
MRFQLTEDQKALRAGMRELLARRFDGEALRVATEEPGLDRSLWRELGAAGFFALRVPEPDGGVGLGLPEAVLVFEEAGRALLPGPLVATHLAAGTVPGAASGEAVVTDVDSGGLVEWLSEADVVRGDATGAVPLRSVDPLTPLHRVPAAGGAPGRSSTTAPGRSSTTAPGRSSSTTSTRDPSPSGLPVARSPHAAEPVAVLLTAAEQLGTATRVCELAVQHAGAREQFGQPIGAFQAVKHLCAQMLVRAETARAAVYAAAVTADPVDVAAARLLADEAAERGARDCLQVHGGMGFTWECEVQLHLKRAWVRSRRAGGGAESEELLAVELLA